MIGVHGAPGVEDVTTVYPLAEKHSGNKINLEELGRGNKEVTLRKRREVRGVIPTPQGQAAGGLLETSASSE